MVAVAVSFFVAGAVLGAWSLHLVAPKPAETGTLTPSSIPAALPVGDRSTTALSQPGAGAVYTGAKFSATVTDIVDGDTVDVAGPKGVTSIRLAGIDAPEHGQAFGTESLPPQMGAHRSPVLTAAHDILWARHQGLRASAGENLVKARYRAKGSAAAEVQRLSWRWHQDGRNLGADAQRIGDR